MYKNIATQTLRNPLHKLKKIEVDVLRLDQFHPVISGNKWFKLRHHIREAVEQNKKGLVSFGGAYSNHLVAMAWACREQGLQSAGIIRGEENDPRNASLQQMKEAGMDLIFVSRESYRDKQSLAAEFLSAHHEFYCVPEGGRSDAGIRGASEILALAKNDYSHIFCAVGTGTTLAGIINASRGEQQVIGISAIKVADSRNNDVAEFVAENADKKNYSLSFDYHFGGFAKFSDELIACMNELYERENVPTDFVYTGKLFYAVDDMIRNDRFSAGSRLLIVHSGGLQGNRSLRPGTLVFS
jgi:1-aminocyclopropane-1-carboxylate deaminase/D-cysteine desulfhydrase-like pyridoxal-dependent ACC family enzyme